MQAGKLRSTRQCWQMLWTTARKQEQSFSWQQRNPESQIGSIQPSPLKTHKGICTGGKQGMVLKQTFIQQSDVVRSSSIQTFHIISEVELMQDLVAVPCQGEELLCEAAVLTHVLRISYFMSALRCISFFEASLKKQY